VPLFRQVPGLFQVLRQFFFSFRAPLANDAHLLGCWIFVPGCGTWLPRPCRTPCAVVAQIRLGIFAHKRIVPQP
jgi:hypothetical protein